MQKRKSDMRAEKEKHLREVIASCKERLQNFKIARSTNLGGKGWLGEQIRKHKTILTACKHELNRNKGIESVVIPKNMKCKCGCCLFVDWEYCPSCGKRIFWRNI